MQHLFVPYDLDVKAKEKNFNEPCIARYDNEKGEILFIISSLTSPMYNYDDDIQAFSRYCAPLYQQLVDWFREKHGIKIVENPLFGWDVYLKYDDSYVISSQHSEITEAFTNAFELIK